MRDNITMRQTSNNELKFHGHHKHNNNQHLPNPMIINNEKGETHTKMVGQIE